MSSHSSSKGSLDKVPVRQNSKQQDDSVMMQQQQLSAIKVNTTKDQSFQKELQSIQEESLRNQSRQSDRSKYQKSIQEMVQINKELDDLFKITNDCVVKTMGRRNQTGQVVQSKMTGDLKSQFSTVESNNYKMMANETKSIQASLANHVNKKITSSVSSVIEKVPSENPISNERRIVMKHEGIQTEEKNVEQQKMIKARGSVSVPKLQLPQRPLEESQQKHNQSQQFQQNLNLQQQQSQSFNNTSGLPQRTQSRFINSNQRKPSQQLYRTQYNPLHFGPSYQQMVQMKPTLVVSDFYRHSNTNIQNIQFQHQAHSSIQQLQQQSYQNVLEQHNQQQQQLQQYRTQQSLMVMNQGHFQNQSISQKNFDNRGIHTGRFSQQSHAQQPQFNNLDHAINTLLK